MIAIVNNGGHNISSVKFALERLGYRSVITSKIVEIQNSDKVILPGVGSAKDSIKRLKDNNLIQGQVFTIFVITVAAAEAAVGLAILLSLYRNRVTVDMESFNLLIW